MRRVRIDRVHASALLAAAACFGFLPLSFAAPIAAVAAWSVQRWMPLLGTRSAQAARLEQRVQLPLALDVLSLSLDAGIAWDRSVMYASDCCTDALAADLRTAAGRLAMGAAPDEVWRGSDSLTAIGMIVERSFRSGAAVSLLLRQHADSERAAERLRRIENSRRLSTKILMPVSFLGYPAFVVLGLIPVLVSTFWQLDVDFLPTG